MIDLIKKEFYENPIYVIVVFFFITFAYFLTPYIGLIISILILLSGHMVLKTDNYKISSVIKLYLVFITSFLVFAKMCNLLPFNINTIVRILLFLNVICLATTTIHNPYIHSPINNFPLTIIIILLAMCTPYILITKNQTVLKPSIIPNSLYVILFTIILGYYYIQHEKFQEHNILLLGSLVIPMIGHFINNSWLELRALWLCMIGLFEIVDIRHYGY
tara:strand:+ start:7972 stop:8625 length:654 start_codon:yes stop_codon:yes gene_type:complete